MRPAKRQHRGADAPLRQSYVLTPPEREEFTRLCRMAWRHEGQAFQFWGKVAMARGLDYRTIIGNTDDPSRFSGLPFGHGKHWCFPYALKCASPPPEFTPLHAVAD